VITATNPSDVPAYKPFVDPIVEEVWAIKAEINRQAGYSVAEIVRRAQFVTLESARASLLVPADQRLSVLYGGNIDTVTAGVREA
jgi:hypothetical protein